MEVVALRCDYLVSKPRDPDDEVYLTMVEALHRLLGSSQEAWNRAKDAALHTDFLWDMAAVHLHEAADLAEQVHHGDRRYHDEVSHPAIFGLLDHLEVLGFYYAETPDL